MNVYFVRDTVKLGREVLDGRLQEQYIWQTSLSGVPVNPLGHLLQGPWVRVDSYVKLVWVLPSRLVYKDTVAGSDIDHHPFAGMVR